MNWVRIAFESRIDHVVFPSSLVRQVCGHLELDDLTTYQIEVCAVEAVTNVIRHAYSGATGKPVTLEIRFDCGRIQIELSDRGAAMDPECARRLRDAGGSGAVLRDDFEAGSLHEGGMGIGIMQAWMDQASYSRARGVNYLRLVKYLGGERSAFA